MKKLLLSLAACCMVSSIALADNKGIELSGHYNSSNPQYRIDIDHTILPGVTTQSDLLSRSISFGCWVRPTSLSGSSSIIAYGGTNHNNSNTLVNVYAASDGAIRVTGFGITGSASLGLPIIDFGASLTIGEWHHVAFSIDFENHELRCYFDGAWTNTTTFTADQFQSFDDNPFGISFGRTCFIGAFDELQIIDGPITAIEANNLKEASYEAVENLLAVYHLDEPIEGTTGQFANAIDSDNDTPAIYNSLRGTYASWAGGIVDCTPTEAAPTFVDGYNASAAIEGIASDINNANAPIEYFNIQGIRVAPENVSTGLYIIRQGSETSKVLIRK